MYIPSGLESLKLALFQAAPHQHGRCKVLQSNAGGLEQRDLVLALAAFRLAAAKLEQIALNVLQADDLFSDRDSDIARTLGSGRPRIDKDPGAADGGVVGLTGLGGEGTDQINMSTLFEPVAAHQR